MEDPLEPVRSLVGTWRGSGRGAYPTITSFGYVEEITFGAVPGKPFLTYASRTRHADDDRPLHGEVGFLRGVGAGRFELVLAQGPGLVEVLEGAAADGVLDLASTVVAGSTTAKRVTATTRTYRWSTDALTYDVSMAAVGLELTHHLHGDLAPAT